jgi:hypothetical protein
MSERALCDLLIRKGVDAGLPVDQVVEQLAEVAFPAFINMADYRATLFEAAEGQLRSEYEARLAALRQKVYADDAPAVNGLVEQAVQETADVAGHVLQTTTVDPAPAAAAEADDMDVFASQSATPEPAGAADETAVWVTNNGEPVRRQFPDS